MAGYEILALSGDSTSLVLPITNEGQRYKISFASEFGFEPDSFSQAINSVLHGKTGRKGYLVEVRYCGQEDIVYSYKVGSIVLGDSDTIIPCIAREYPVDCYEVYVSFSGAAGEVSRKTEDVSQSRFIKAERSNFSWWWLAVLGFIVPVGIYLWRSIPKRSTNRMNEIIDIGAYRFDKRNMTLTFKDESIELTSKEADLLFLLHSSANETIERDTILRIVWGDEGDYVGRTLDVFISKLRKKLAGDPGIKIANIRGVGYRLVVN